MYTILDFHIVLVYTSMKTVCQFRCCECGPNSPTSGMYHAEESTGVLRRAETEYKGHRSLLMRTRNLLSTMRRQDVLDRYRYYQLFAHLKTKQLKSCPPNAHHY